MSIKKNVDKKRMLIDKNADRKMNVDSKMNVDRKKNEC